jgi:lauroyl/myristoyl acyltransferase
LRSSSVLRTGRRRRHLRCRFVKADGGLRPLLREPDAGRSIGLLVDLLVEAGERVPFCGRDTTTTLVPARLALKVGCPLVPVRVERVRPAYLRVTLHDPVSPDERIAPDLEARRMMARINALFEAWIVARPHEWQCFQNRWPKSTRRAVLQARARRCACRPCRCGRDPASWEPWGTPARAARGWTRSILRITLGRAIVRER